MIKIFPALVMLLVSLAFTEPDKRTQAIQILPLQLSGSAGTENELVIYLTGDGGWNSFSQKLTKEIEQKGYGVVTLNSRKYFRNKKTPEVFAKDIELLSNYYLKAWNKTSVIIIGYSFGADVAAFLPKRLTKSLLARIDHIALLSPSASTDFVINLLDLIGDSKNVRRKYKLGTELNQPGLPVVCIFGTKEDLKLKNTLQNRSDITIHEIPGSHNYKNNTELLIKLIGLK